MKRLPANGDEALSQALGTSSKYAGAVRRRIDAAQGFDETDSAIRASAALASLEAAKSICEYDIADAAQTDDPTGSLNELVQMRADEIRLAQYAAQVASTAPPLTAAQRDTLALILRGTPSQRRTAARIAAHESWARTEDRAARTSNARAALDAKFLEQADGDPVRADHLRKAYFLRLAQRSAAARSRRKGKPLIRG